MYTPGAFMEFYLSKCRDEYRSDCILFDWKWAATSTRYDAKWLTVLNCFPNLPSGIKENKWSIGCMTRFRLCICVCVCVYDSKLQPVDFISRKMTFGRHDKNLNKTICTGFFDNWFNRLLFCPLFFLRQLCMKKIHLQWCNRQNLL